MCKRITHLDSYHLFGKIKSITEKISRTERVVLEHAKPDIINTFENTEVSKFNVHGNLVSHNIYNHKGILKQVNTYKYNDKQYVTKHIIRIDGGVNSKMEYYYNEEDKIIETKYYLWDNYLLEHTVDNDINMDGAETSFCYDAKGELDHVTYYTLNEKGSITESKKCKPDGTVIDSYVSVYDDQERERKRIFSNCLNWHKTEILYDEWHNEIEKFLFATEDKVDKHRTFFYRFDAYNNWIHKTVIENGFTYEVTERVIEYY